ncbi:amidohydrolase [Microtetraspora sp. NBRC 16547]|uniref:amidohydrolase n=1 Tax=Microtetraspora sp. NBRC 16547 TaxID=3030993 RepID=UPI00249FAA3F|nr:amidohydrolase [Microtetraspora sp. NBRC 16547]GLX01903.1 cytosine deaminase [Microtetraspora sp. NBRC 16547]
MTNHTADADTRTIAGASATVFRDVRPFGGPAVDLVAVDGVLADAVPDGAVVEYVDGGGRLALPTLVDAHIHPDKTAWGEPWHSRRPARGIAEYVAGDVELHRALPTPVAERARRLMAHAAAQGTRAMRAHADVAPAYGLEGVTGVAEAREKLRDVLDVQLVAFPQHGVERTPGAAKLLEEAAAGGLIDVVGGIDPAGFDRVSGDGTSGENRQLDVVFGIAERYGLAVDIHLHDVGERGLGPLREIAARTEALGLRGKVTVSHAFAVATLSGWELDATADLLASADIALTTVAPSATTVLPFRRLAERGVRVGLGSDGVRDNWSPYGNADMLHRAWLLGWTLDLRLDEELEACFRLAADGGADLLGLPKADLRPGAPADFMLVEGECLPQVVIDLPRRDVVVRAGRVVARDGRLV